MGRGSIIEEFINDERKRFAQELLELGKLSEKEIARCTKLPLKTVAELADKILGKE